MIPYSDALEAGMTMAKKSATIFWNQNQQNYARLGVEAQDLEAHLYENVLVPKYLKTVETQPTFYPTIARFKASLYRAFRNALLVHHQAHIKCQKRGDILRAGVIELNADLPGSDESVHTELSTQTSQAYLSSVKEMVDTCPCPHSARGLILLAYGKCDSKTDLRKKMTELLDMGKAQFEIVWERIVDHMRSFEFTPTSIVPVLQS